MKRPELRKILLTGHQSERTAPLIAETAPNATVVIANDPETIAREIVDAQVTIGGRIEPEHLRLAEQLVWHHVPWVGVEGIIDPVFAEKGVTLTNGSGVNSANIAEHVIALMLAFARSLPRFVRDQSEHQWRHWDQEPTYFELGGKQVLCLGTGEIGQEVARRLRAFGCELVGASRSGRDVPGFARCVSFEHLDDILPTADHIVNSLPMTPGTAGIVSREHIQNMKQGAYFYNVGRGGTVDQEALIEALESGHLAGAGLDVVSPEPLPADHPLWDVQNVIITSHTSGNSPDAHQRMVDLTVAQIKRYLNDEPLHNVVDQTAGY